MPKLKYIGIDYKKADVGIRGLFSLSANEKSQLYIQLRECFGIQEALILSTCNRTEIYYVHKPNIGEQLVALLASLKGLSGREYLSHFNIVSDDNQTINHLFRMAIGLESQVLGDIQIFGQVKQAYQEATDADMASATLHRALHTLFYTHKQVCQETAFKQGAASTSYNAVKILSEYRIAEDAKILVAGAGKIGTDICKNLLDLGYTQVTITNRTKSKAIALAQQLNFSTIDFDEKEASLPTFDVLISAAGGESYVFHTENNIQPTAKKFFILDLCAPNSFSDDFIEDFSSHYFNIDRIGERQEETLNTRKSEVSKVEQIIAESLEQWNEWLVEFGQTRELKKFKQTLEEISKQCMAEHVKKLDDIQLALIEEIATSMIKKIVKIPAVQIKSACKREEADKMSEVLNELFNLEHKTRIKPKTNQL